MSTITLLNENNAVEISLYGGHVLSWRHQQRQILWLSELADLSGASAIRGGVPICFPWFAEQGSPKHGFARTQQWHLAEQSATVAVLTLSPNEHTLAIWPHRFLLTLTVTLHQNQLELALKIDNTDTKPWAFGGALHSYFSCEDARNVQIDALTGRPYVNSLAQGKEQQFDSTTLPNPIDAIVPDLEQINASIEDTSSRPLLLQHSGSDSCVIWNPADNHPSDVSPRQRYQFICFEAAIAVAPINLAPGESHLLSQLICA